MNRNKQQSILNLYLELKKLDTSTKKSELLFFCTSQHKLTKYKDDSKRIIPMTLNTFKEYSNSCLEGGFATIDNLRKKLHENVTGRSGNKKRRKEEKLRVYKSKLEESERARAILIRAYNDLNSICLDAISINSPYEQDYKKHKLLYDNYFSLSLYNGD